MVAVDSTFFPYLLNHKTRAPNDPATGKPVDRIEERIELLIETLEEDRETIIIPTPALSEFLVLAKEDGPNYLKAISRNPLFQIQPFDVRAAIELAAIRLNEEKTLSKSALKRQTPQETWAKISFDRQIVAIAKVNGANTIYSEDTSVANFARKNGIKVVRVWELPLPKEIQESLPFPTSEEPAATPEIAPASVIRIADKRIDKDAGAEEGADPETE